jgi:hypothetical protein
MDVQDPTPPLPYFEVWERLQTRALVGIKGAAAAAAVSSSLDPQESNWQREDTLLSPGAGRPEWDLQDASSFEQCFRHSGWRKTRRRVWEVLQECTPRSRQAAFASCGSGVHAYMHPDPTGKTKLKLAAYYCHDRFCQPCASARAATIQRNLVDKLNGIKRVRFVTLTIKPRPDEPLSTRVRRLYVAFLGLRRRKWWKLRVDGGAAFCEVKIGRGGDWHPHLHCLIEGEYMPQAQLSDEWLSVTTDSKIVDVRGVSSFDDLARYVTKYVTKLAPLSDLNHSQLQELIISCKGIRSCLTFGSWRKWQLTKNADAITDWIDLGNVEALFRRAVAMDEDALRKAALIAQHYPLLVEMFDAHLKRQPPP